MQALRAPAPAARRPVASRSTTCRPTAAAAAAPAPAKVEAPIDVEARSRDFPLGLAWGRLGHVSITSLRTPNSLCAPQNVLGIILGGGAGTRLYPLTKKRAKPAVPLVRSAPPGYPERLACCGDAGARRAACRPADGHSGASRASGGAQRPGRASSRPPSREPPVSDALFAQGANYRLIDIPVSNCINSDINKIYCLTQFNSASLNRHLSNAYVRPRRRRSARAAHPRPRRRTPTWARTRGRGLWRCWRLSRAPRTLTGSRRAPPPAHPATLH